MVISDPNGNKEVIITTVLQQRQLKIVLSENAFSATLSPHAPNVAPVRPAKLTILAVVGDLHLALLRAQQRLGHLGDGMPVGELAVQEVTGARLLHDIWPGEAGHLAEAVITVDDSTVLHPGIGYDEFLICWGGRRVGVECEYPTWGSWMCCSIESTIQNIFLDNRK